MRRFDFRNTAFGSSRAADFGKRKRLVNRLILLMAWWSTFALPAHAGVILLPGGTSEERTYLRSGAIELEATGPGESTYLDFENSPAHTPYMTGYAASDVNEFVEGTGGFVGGPGSDSSFFLYAIADVVTDAKTFWTGEEPPAGWEEPTTFLSASVNYSALFRVEKGGRADLSYWFLTEEDPGYRLTLDHWFQISRLGASNPLISSDAHFEGGTEFGGAPIILEAGDYRVDLQWSRSFEFESLGDAINSVSSGELLLIFRSIEGPVSPIPEASSITIWTVLGVSMGLVFLFRGMPHPGRSGEKARIKGQETGETRR